MRYLVIIDNGQLYSSHRHQPVVCCETLGEAETAQRVLTNEWQAMHDLRSDDGYMQSYEAWPEDIPSLRRLGFAIDDWHFLSDTTFAVIPIPEWADVTRGVQAGKSEWSGMAPFLDVAGHE